ncbi:unnamed protein product [Ectocarpus fasciculatus]
MSNCCGQCRSKEITKDLRQIGPADNALRVVPGKGLRKTMRRDGAHGSPFLMLRQTVSRHLTCRLGTNNMMANCRSSLTTHERIRDVFVEESLKTCYPTAVPVFPLLRGIRLNMSMYLTCKQRMITNRS